MKKTMYDVSVASQDGIIFIEQPSQDENGECVMLHPEQIDLVIKWMREAKSEIIKRQKKPDLPVLPRKKPVSKPQNYFS